MNMQSDKGSQQQTNSNEIVTTEHQKKKHNKIYISGQSKNSRKHLP